MKLILILIIGSLLLASIPFLTDKPLLEGGYKEIITRVYGEELDNTTPSEDTSFLPNSNEYGDIGVSVIC